LSQLSARLACDDPDEMAAEGAPTVQWLMEKGWALSLPDDPLEPPKKEPARAKVREVPHDGRLIFGGAGVLIPFRPKLVDAPATQSPQMDILAPGQEDPEPAMKGARLGYERQAMELASREEPASLHSTTRKPSGQA
jgi:hypothetical protein